MPIFTVWMRPMRPLRTASVATRNVFHGFEDRCWLPGLQDALLRAHGRPQRDGLVDVVGERLLDVEVLAGQHGLDRDDGVPVVGRRHDHRVDVGPREHLVVVR